MSVSSIDNKYYSALNQYLNKNTGSSSDAAGNAGKTQAAGSTGATGNTSQAISPVDGYQPGSSASELLNSGFLNYGPNSAYTTPTLADFLTEGSSSPDDIMSLADDNAAAGAEDAGLTDSLSAAGDMQGDGSSQIDSVFSSLADEVQTENSQLIQNALAKAAKKDGAANT